MAKFADPTEWVDRLSVFNHFVNWEYVEAWRQLAEEFWFIYFIAIFIKVFVLMARILSLGNWAFLNSLKLTNKFPPESDKLLLIKSSSRVLAILIKWSPSTDSILFLMMFNFLRKLNLIPEISFRIFGYLLFPILSASVTNH